MMQVVSSRSYRFFALLVSLFALIACSPDQQRAEFLPNVHFLNTAACSDSAASPDPLDSFNLAAAPLPSAEKPALATSIHESGYGLCITRLTDHSAQPPIGFARTDYSRRQSFSADDASLLVIDDDGAWHLYNPVTAMYIKTLRALAGAAEPQWDPVQAHLLTYLPQAGEMLQLSQLNVLTDEIQVFADLAPMLRALWPEAARMNTGAEGSPSANHRFWAFQVSDATGGALGIVVWDQQLHEIVASRAITRLPDHLSMSPSGDYVVVSWITETVVFDRQLNNRRTLQRSSEHSDLAIGADGDDYYVSIDYAADDGDLFMIHLPTGVRSLLLPTYLNRQATTLHVSGKAYDNPGWIVLSTFSRSRDDPQWLYQRVWLVQLAITPQIYPLAFHQSLLQADETPENYWAEPQASTNRTLSMVTFNSNWRSPSLKNVDVYKLDLPVIPDVSL